MAHCLSSEGMNSGSLSLHSPQTGQTLSFVAIDAYAKLVILILKVFYAHLWFFLEFVVLHVHSLNLFVLCFSVLRD